MRVNCKYRDIYKDYASLVDSAKAYETNWLNIKISTGFISLWSGIRTRIPNATISDSRYSKSRHIYILTFISNAGIIKKNMKEGIFRQRSLKGDAYAIRNTYMGEICLIC